MAEQGASLAPADSNGFLPGLFRVRRIDGGYAWIVFACVAYCSAITRSIPYLYGLLIPPCKEHFQEESVAIMALPNSLCVFLTLFGLPAGWLADKYQHRYVVMVGSVIATIGMIISATSSSIAQVIVGYGVVVGIGHSMVQTPSVGILNMYFDKRRKFVNAAYIISVPALVIAGTPLLNWVLSTFGCTSSFYLLTIWTAGGVICGFLYVRPTAIKKSISAQPGAVYNKPLHTVTVAKTDWPAVFRNPWFYALLFHSFCWFGTINCFYSFLPMTINDKFNTTESSDYIFTMGIVDLCGRSASSAFLLFYPQADVVLILLVTNSCFLPAFFLAPFLIDVSVWLFVIIFGFTYGLFGSSFTTSFIKKAVSESNVATSMGIYFTCGGIGGLVMQNFFGALVDSLKEDGTEGNYVTPYFVVGAIVCSSLGPLWVLWLWEKCVKKPAEQSSQSMRINAVASGENKPFIPFKGSGIPHETTTQNESPECARDTAEVDYMDAHAEDLPAAENSAHLAA